MKRRRERKRKGRKKGRRRKGERMDTVGCLRFLSRYAAGSMMRSRHLCKGGRDSTALGDAVRFSEGDRGRSGLEVRSPITGFDSVRNGSATLLSNTSSSGVVGFFRHFISFFRSAILLTFTAPIARFISASNHRSLRHVSWLAAHVYRQLRFLKSARGSKNSSPKFAILYKVCFSHPCHTSCNYSSVGHRISG